MLNEALKQIRKFHGLKQNQLAEKLEISTSYLSEIESNQKKVSMEILQKYSEVFSIPMSSLMIFSENLETKRKGKKIKLFCSKKIIAIMEWLNEKK